MTSIPETSVPLQLHDDGRSPLPDRWMAELGTLLEQLESTAAAGRVLPSVPSSLADEKLVMRRLGVAGSLYEALGLKHAASAGHALRVSLFCSAWAEYRGQTAAEREALEIAALMHDVGVIGVPDQVLLKPGPLDPDEAVVMTQARQMSLKILGRGCASPEVLEIIEHTGAWYDGSRNPGSVRGEAIPSGARMIAIAEAFDAMTTDHVFRPAISHERAMAELFRCAGSQFDPRLVQQFAEFRDGLGSQFPHNITAHWCATLGSEPADRCWGPVSQHPAEPAAGLSNEFHAKLLDNMYDAVIFVDASGCITHWNHGAERLTGIASSSMQQKQWRPELLAMTDEKGSHVTGADCPVQGALQSGVQSLRRLTIYGRSGRPVSVDTHAMPVIAADGTTQGAILLLHDASSEISLEHRCQSLHEKATRDPLTQVANRAEFDRVHAMFVAAHLQQQVPCSLLMCDLDHFKKVNDTYGHQAGDDAIKGLAALMKNACRPGDLVARYGGEEFVMLLADCDNAAATRRAEQIRVALAQLTQPKMGGRAVTASFGVTEIQPGDTPETMLRRADRGLLTAKTNGRNTVVQLGTGSGEPEQEKPVFRIFGPAKRVLLLKQTLVSPVPVKMAIEKLRGFVADHRANVLKIDNHRVELEIDDKPTTGFRRLTDRPVSFHLDIQFEEVGGGPDGEKGHVRTKIHVEVGPRRNCDRRRADASERAKQVLVSFRSYLMAVPEEGESPSPPTTLGRAKRILTPWWRKG